MAEPRATRPYMPGYPREKSGDRLLSWSVVERRLADSHDYWVASRTPDGAPHVLPVWGAWLDGAVWFSGSRESRKSRNLLADPRVAVATSNAQEPAVVEGIAAEATEETAIRAFAVAIGKKYKQPSDPAFYLNPGNICFSVRPTKVLALTEEDFSGSPTRFTFG